jgi:hypothetical protein
MLSNKISCFRIKAVLMDYFLKNQQYYQLRLPGTEFFGYKLVRCDKPIWNPITHFVCFACLLCSAWVCSFW